MNTQEIIKTVQSLPIGEQRRVLEVLQNNLTAERETPISEDEIERILLAKGIISEIPERLPDDEEESYEPIEVIGKPLSETIIEERG